MVLPARRGAHLPVLGLALLAACLAALLAGPARAGETYEQALERYDTWVRRATLIKRNRAREALARTGDARALPVLVRDYAKPEEPKDHVRYLLVTIAATHLAKDPALAAPWTAWRRRYAQAEHAWLWYRAVQVEAALGAADAAEALTADKADPFLQAATLLALAHMDPTARKSGPAPTQAALALLGKPPSTPLARGLLAEAAAMTLATRSEPWKDETATALTAKVIDLLKDPATAPRTRLVAARALARALATDVVDLSPELWQRELDARRGGTPAEPPPPDRYAGPRFVGLPASGRRIVYVIDASDSMLAPLAGPEKESLQQPLTPAGGDPGKRPADDLPWDRIRTRFDAARECLKASLQRLDKERAFCVVLFGDKARTLESTPQLMTATPKALKAAVRELDALEPTSTKTSAEFPHGQLLGSTNLHGGLRLAFQVKAKGAVEAGEHVDAKLLEEGCDTVFLLSDGIPSWDDFEGTEAPDPEDQPGNPESGTDGKRTPMMTFDGPYGQFHAAGDYLHEDVRRMNLFRHAEIHCVAIGEADDRLITRIAELGLGRVRRIGPPAAPAPR